MVVNLLIIIRIYRMPELPEVETIRRALEPALVNAVIESTYVRTSRLRTPLAEEELDNFSSNSKVLDVRRRGKYLIVEMQSLKSLIIHLGMTGNIRIEHTPDEPFEQYCLRHDHVVWRLRDGRAMFFNDPRRFGMVIMQNLSAAGALPPCLEHIGPEPYDERLTGSYLYKETRNCRRTIKDVLLDQSLVTGIGNIYASEILFDAQIIPRKKVCNVGLGRYERLVQSTQKIMDRAIAAEGTTISDYTTLTGTEGQFTQFLKVYDKKGEGCSRCGPDYRIRRITVNGRSTFYCPHCQH